MTFSTSYNKTEKLYKQHLAIIKDVKFTFREIDLIVCILHNRGEKKIASMLSIAPKTVSTHVYNVMNKLSYNSKDQIIDFIENSGTLPIIREYYLHLLVKANFEKQLIYIGTRINRYELICYCYRDDILSLDNTLYQSIQNHLKLANITLIEISDATSYNNSSITPIFILDKIYEATYYKDLLENILAIINATDVQEKEKIISDFNSNYKLVEEIYNSKAESQVHQPNNTRQVDEIPSRDITVVQNLLPRLWHKLWRNKPIILLAALGLSLFVIIVLILSFRTNQNTVSVIDRKPDLISTEAPEVIKDLEEFLQLTKDIKFSADNTNAEQIQKNHSLVKKIEKILEYNTKSQIQEYLQKAEMSAEILTYYLYNLQALACYYMYNMNDGEKATKLLLYGKELAENYVNIRSKVNNDFNVLSSEEAFAELSIIEHLPQIYTRVVYALGRTYIYNKRALEGKKYFELAKYFGNRLNLFEEYLSEISGLLIIENDIAADYLKEGKIQEAKKLLQNIVQGYASMREYNRDYILDYKPGIIAQKTIIPKENTYNLFECSTRIISGYAKLIEMADNKEELNDYIAEINKYLQGDDKIKGLFQIADKIPDKKLANLYNRLANLVLTLWRINKDQTFSLDNNDSKLRQTIAAVLIPNNGNIQENQHLHLAEQLFTSARNKSRNSDFTKGDAYLGLIKTYQLMITHQENMSASQIQELKDKIQIISDKLKLVDDTRHQL